VSADRLNTILSEIKKNRPRGERGITIRQTGDGTYVGLAANFQTSNLLQQKPWDIYLVDQPDQSTFTVKVHPGTISNILPDNWDNEFSVGEGLYYGVATLATDGKLINGITLGFQETPPAQQEPQKFGIESSVEYLFGLFASGTSFNVLNQSIYLYPRLRLVTSADPAAAPGESPFDLWYELAT